MTELEISAYHESGKVVFAYHLGFSCSQSIVSETDFNRGSTSLQVGQDKPLVDIILQRTSFNQSEKDIDELRTVAMKLLNLFASGTCARVYYSNAKQIDAETEIDLPGGDYSQIELVKTFLEKHDPFFSDALIQMVFSGIFKKLSLSEFSNPIEKLANAFIACPDRKLIQSDIEGILRNEGMNIPLPIAKPFVSISVTDKPKLENDNNSKSNQQNSSSDESFIKVRNILINLKPSLSDSEIRKFYNEIESAFN